MIQGSKYSFRVYILDYEIFEGDIILDKFEFDEGSGHGLMDDAISKRSQLWDVILPIVIDVHFG